MNKNIGRYSKYLRPLTIAFDVIIINLFQNLVFDQNTLNLIDLLITSIFWLVASLITKFYEVYRFTKLIQIADKALKQFALFALFSFAYIGFLSKDVSNTTFLKYLFLCFLIIISAKYSIFYALKIFRRYYNGNQRRVVVIGSNQSSNQLVDFFQTEKDYGYVLSYHFKDNETANEVLKYCENENIDEIYFSLEKATDQELNQYISFVDDNFRILKYIPTKTELVSNTMQVQYYGFIPIIPLRKFPLQQPINQFIKRTFDLIVSTFVIVFVLSWLVPIVGLFIKLESKGPVFFNQRRNGLHYKEFKCFKFRSMYVNNESETKQATKNDKRITKIGRFLRKSSLDEMPQFLNVFIGNMSICGPRPHPISLTHQYAKKVDKFKLRHYIKPGISGMAQTHGCRGEIENERDIVNRVKYDIFYLENWTLLLDFKIVYLTVKNAILGDKKAY